MKSSVLRKFSITLAAVLATTSLFTVPVKAAAPVITVKTTGATAASVASASSAMVRTMLPSELKSVSGLRIINLEQPKIGELFDQRATVMTDQGYFWDIPVVWVDEEGQISLICLPGKKYTPVLAFYIPGTVAVECDEAIGGYQIRLPEYLDGIMSSEDLVMISDPGKNITFITSVKLAEALAEGAQDGAAVSMLVGSGTVAQFLSGVANTQAYDYASYSEKEEALQAAGSDEEQKEQEEYQDEADDPGVSPAPEDVLAKLVKIHCTPKVIDKLGNENLKSLLDLLIYVIEPQAVFTLTSGFPSYSAAANSNPAELGSQIGLYVYSHTATDDPKKDIDALAFVDGGYVESGDDSFYSYYIGVDTDSIYKYNEETQKYEISQYDMDTLNNTMVHEMMHAFMDDFNRTGMAGLVPEGSEYSEDENKFPNWFVEGTASCVENIYEFRKGVINEIRGGTSSGAYTEQTLIDYYTTIHEDENPRIDFKPVTDADRENNERRDYINGYLASLYLSDLAIKYMTAKDAQEHPEVTHSQTKIVDQSGNRSYNNEGFLEGLDIILNSLHVGTTMDDIVSTISYGKYESVADFEKKFIITSADNTRDDGSIEFCVDFLNYLNEVSVQITEETGENFIANGSILLPFDTKDASPIKDRDHMPDMGKQKSFVIVTSNDFVESMADVTKANSSAGVKTTGIIVNGEGESQTTSMQDDMAIAAKEGTKDGEAVAKENVVEEEAEEAEEAEVVAEEAAESDAAQAGADETAKSSVPENDADADAEMIAEADEDKPETQAVPETEEEAAVTPDASQAPVAEEASTAAAQEPSIPSTEEPSTVAAEEPSVPAEAPEAVEIPEVVETTEVVETPEVVETTEPEPVPEVEALPPDDSESDQQNLEESGDDAGDDSADNSGDEQQTVEDSGDNSDN